MAKPTKMESLKALNQKCLDSYSRQVKQQIEVCTTNHKPCLASKLYD